MTGIYKDVACGKCGTSITVGIRTVKVRYCAVCRIERMIENYVSLKTRSGEPYQRLLTAQAESRAEGVRGRGPGAQSS